LKANGVVPVNSEVQPPLVKQTLDSRPNTNVDDLIHWLEKTENQKIPGDITKNVGE